MTSQRIGKYARLETERRYLLTEAPADLAVAASGWWITDRYFPGTRMRLRCMKSLVDGNSIFKLTQKYRSADQSAMEATITNLYLNEAEHNLLNSLDARLLQKVRYPYRVQGWDFSVDVFEGRHRGLILAEVELEETALEDVASLPGFVLKEVTSDPFFHGGHLAMMSDDEFRRGLAEQLSSPK